VFVYSSRGKWVFPHLLWSFPSTSAFTSFPTPGCWVCAAAPAFSSQLVVRDFPSSPFVAQCAPPSLLCVFFVVIAYYSVFFFFPCWGLVFPGGYADLAQGCLWEYCVPLSSPCVCVFPSHLVLPPGCGTGALLVSPFNVKWRFSAQAGGVEESKFCLFSVVFPVRCVSSVSPRFYFRRQVFCFLPLAAILVSVLIS
jgi:hypothetical protein